MLIRTSVDELEWKLSVQVDVSRRLHSGNV